VGTIRRMEANEGVLHGTIESLMRLVEALDRAGVEVIEENATSTGHGRGVRLAKKR
jgi:hypothetical protein